MEPITLCGLVIVAFGLWVEFEPAIMAVVKKIRNSRIYKLLLSQLKVQPPACDGRVPVCYVKSHS